MPGRDRLPSRRHVTAPPAVGGRAKRALDLAIALPACVVLLPVMIAIGIWIRWDSAGPAIFRQERIGLRGRPFRLLKFRTMVVGAQQMGPGLAVDAGDARITRAGHALRRLSLDELPQLWNVVRGDMSIVGPRPTVAAQVERYTDEQRRRLDARPGITGLAQVRGRAAIPWSERIAIDVEYVAGWSIRRDLWILLRTAVVVARRDGTYRGDSGGFDLPARDEEGTPSPR
jgi:lipopolysaccharide/colanic/teichoic acid biosynthesis glycosyltransferase